MKVKLKILSLCLSIAVFIALNAVCFADVSDIGEAFDDSSTEFGDSQIGLENFQASDKYADGMFSDVPSSAWFTENIKSVYNFGLMKGDSATTFSPKGQITIAQAITMAARLHCIFYNGSEDFVQGKVWYQEYVDYCLLYGILDEGQFNTFGRAATRSEFAQLLSKALPQNAFEIINWVENGTIPDIKTNSDYAEGVYLLYRAGILTGSDEKGTFNPESTITRAEAAAIVTRIVDPSLRKPLVLTEE